MDSPKTIQLRIPKQDMQSLTFDGATPKKMADWIEALPKINVGESSRLLYNAIQELNRYQIDTKNRYLILEQMRSTIHYVCKSLGKHFLNQSIVLDEKETKIANLAQAMQNHLAIGYKIVLLDTLSQKTADAAKLRAYATHRAISELSENLLRCYQLYYPTPKGLWQELHQLYLLADHYKILSEVVEDSSTNSKLSIEHCYLRTMLLSTARPNQLRQQEIAQLGQVFNIWSRLSKLKKPDEKPEPFIVDLHSDEGARYSQWNKDALNNTQSSIRYVHVSSLALELTHLLKNPEKRETQDISIKMLPDTVIRHLIQSWSASTQRAFARTATEGTLSLAFGLGAVHYYISEGQDFAAMLQGDNKNLLIQDEDNPFLNKGMGNRNYGFRDEIRSGGDVWSLNAVSSTGDGGDIEFKSLNPEQADKAKLATLIPAYDCEIIDTSPGGYCIEWKGNAPPQLKTGEIIAIKEGAQGNWSVGVVRWIKKLSGSSARLGLELLAPHAEACGAKVIQKSGGSTEYMRTIRLPELKAIGQASTLITPRLTFKVGYRVMVNILGQEIKIQLLKEISSTASFSQFEYKIFGSQPNEQEEDHATQSDGFSSLWTSI